MPKDAILLLLLLIFILLFELFLSLLFFWLGNLTDIAFPVNGLVLLVPLLIPNEIELCNFEPFVEPIFSLLKFIFLLFSLLIDISFFLFILAPDLFSLNFLSFIDIFIFWVF